LAQEDTPHVPLRWRHDLREGPMRVVGAVLIAVAVAVLVGVLVWVLAVLPGQREPLAVPTRTPVASDTPASAEPASESSPATPSARPTPVTFSALTVGTCLTDAHTLDQGDGAIDLLEAIPCEGEHYEEVIALGDFADGSYPGADALIDQLDVSCVEAFAAYVGIQYGSSALSLDYLLPTESSWNAGDRGYACLVFGDGALSGTVAGSAR
jgi:hypothetical protein